MIFIRHGILQGRQFSESKFVDNDRGCQSGRDCHSAKNIGW